jgi:hypothetical protein
MVMSLAVDRGRVARYLLAFLVLAVLIAASPPSYLLGFLEDDALFYAVISRNMAHGFGSTFDRVSPTNGYHPLWMLMLSGYLWLLKPFVDTLHGDPEVTLKLLMIFQAALYLISLWLCVDIINKLVPKNSRVALAVFVVAYAFALKQAFLMETGLSLLLMLSIIKMILGSTPHRDIKLSLLFGFWILARLDQAIPVALLGVYVARSQASDFRGFLRTLVKLGAVPILFLAAYLASNYLLFGELYTTSSLLKSRPLPGSPGAVLSAGWRSLTVHFDPRNPRVPIMFLSIAATIPVIPLLGRRHRSSAFDALVVSFAGQLVALLTAGLFQREVRSWYFVLPAILSYMIWMMPLNALLTRFTPRVSRVLKGVTLAAAILLLAGYAYITTTYAVTEGYQWDFFRKVAAETPEDAVIYGIDVTGKASAVSNRRIINGDGLVNSFDYIEHARSGTLDEYFEHAKPSYYLETRSLADQPVRYSGQALSADYLQLNHFEFSPSDLVHWDERISGRIYALYRFDPSIHYRSSRQEP